MRKLVVSLEVPVALWAWDTRLVCSSICRIFLVAAAPLALNDY